MSLIGETYSKIYNKLCGSHPNLYFWHCQWLAHKDIYLDLKQNLSGIEGKVLDVGCGNKPYKNWFNSNQIEKYIGIDIYPGDQVDMIINSEANWQLCDSSFDAILCTQVLEHTIDLRQTLEEIHRVLKPRKQLIITVPFLYNQHGWPDDYRRFSVEGIKEMFKDKYEIVKLKTQGGFGTTIGTLILNWVEMQMNYYKFTRLLKGVLLPFWILFSTTINCMGYLLDKLDTTNSFYSNVFLIARKKCE